MSSSPVPHTPSLHTKRASQTTVVPTVLFQGWLLKKRRKKMQGFARRYFTLYQTGLLSYSFEPGKPSRDQLSIPHAAISTYPGRKDIHIDSHNATFHLKCLSSDDFNSWMVALRRFIAAEGRRSSSLGLSTPRITHLNRSAALVDEMGTTLTELETAVLSWQNEDTHSKHRTSVKKADKEKHKDKDKDHHKDHPKEGGAIFGIFKRAGPHRNDSNHSDTHSEVSQLSAQNRVHAALEALKNQHETLVKSLQALSYIDIPSAPSARASPLASTAEEEEGDYPRSYDVQSSGRFGTPFTRKSTRTSIATAFSDGTTSREWFDAFDGGEEFVLEAEPTPADEKTNLDAIGSRSSLGGSTDAEMEVEDIVGVDSQDKEEVAEMDPFEKAQHVARRTELPSGPVGDEGSLFTLLKKNVGKDLASVTFPVSFNEPITLLQNAAEQLEYFDLLRQAAETQDPVERMCYVAAFAVSGYAHTRHRSGRKSFNPMLAETFEDVRMKYIAEKVQHHPFAMAYHAEGEGWELYATSAGKTKFWGKSLEIIPLGTTHLKIGDDHFTWIKPSSFMRNLVVGTKYLEHQGKLNIENQTTGARCVLEFKQNGYWAPSNEVTGAVFSPSGQTMTHLEGKWDEQIAQTLESSSHLRVLWRTTPFARLANEYYGFTSFGITLNEITEDLERKLPPTDSRFRPDVRALEMGDIEEAEAQKERLEERQRDRRRQEQDMQPKWFELVGDEWIYRGGYWEARANGWKDANIEVLW